MHSFCFLRRIKTDTQKKLSEAFSLRIERKRLASKITLDICKVNIHPCIACGYCQKQTAARFATSMNSIMTYARVICCHRHAGS